MRGLCVVRSDRIADMDFIRQPDGSTRLGDWLTANLTGPWTHFRAAVAFAKRSGTKHIAAPLATFAGTNAVELIVGIDHRGTSEEGLRDLLHAVAPGGGLFVFHNRQPRTFHPKVYLFKSGDKAEVAVGSGNLTEGGLFTNYEAGLRLMLDMAEPADSAVLQSVESVLDHWASPTHGMSIALDNDLLDRLAKSNVVPAEADMAPQTRAPFAVQPDDGGIAALAALFTVRSERPPPVVPRNTSTGARSLAGNRFVMTLQRTDVGVGQTSVGTSKRSPEIFIPLSARNANPRFWGWPNLFREDPTRRGKFDRTTVRMRLGGQLAEVNMMTWPDRHDFRLRSEALRSAGNIGDILRMEKVEPGVGFDYYVEVIPPGTDQYRHCMPRCNQLVQNSRKRFGYY